jgi:cobalt-zinc-cadmium efflux system membrane fusion protein
MNTLTRGEEVDGGNGSLIKVTRDQFEATGMEVGNPTPMLFSDGVHVTGIVKATPSGRAEVSTLIPGRIHRIFHTIGEKVSRGDLLFSLESNEYIELQQEFATVSQRVKLLEAEYKRQKALYQEKVVAEKEFLRTESEYISSLAMMEGLKAKLQLANTSPEQVAEGSIVSYLKVNSPIDGIITGQELVMGHFITPGEVVTEVVNPGTLQLYLQLFEKDLERIAPGLQVLFYTPDRPDMVHEAALLHVGRSIDPSTKKVSCTARIREDQIADLVNNLYIEARIVTCQREVLAVPEGAVLRSGGSTHVLILVEENGEEMTFQARQVEVGPVRDGYVEILDQELKEVLIKGAYNLWTEE